MNVDLIAIDLDDTLLKSDLSISPVNRETLKEASRKGIRVVLASGRNIHSMHAYAKELELLGPGDYMICSNGAEILHSRSERVLDEVRLSKTLCQEVSAAIEERGFPWQIYESGMIHVSKPNDWAYADGRLTGQPIILVEDREVFFERGVLKFVVPGEPAAISKLVTQLSDLFKDRVSILTSKPYFLEVMPLGADKGSALQRLCSMIDLPLSRVMAIGDAMNDLGMMKVAGYGCAPANAIPEIREIARHVSGKTNDEDAVADLVRKVALAS